MTSRGSMDAPDAGAEKSESEHEHHEHGEHECDGDCTRIWKARSCALDETMGWTMNVNDSLND